MTNEKWKEKWFFVSMGFVIVEAAGIWTIAFALLYR